MITFIVRHFSVVVLRVWIRDWLGDLIVINEIVIQRWLPTDHRDIAYLGWPLGLRPRQLQGSYG